MMRKGGGRRASFLVLPHLEKGKIQKRGKPAAVHYLRLETREDKGKKGSSVPRQKESASSLKKRRKRIGFIALLCGDA